MVKPHKMELLPRLTIPLTRNNAAFANRVNFVEPIQNNRQEKCGSSERLSDKFR
jgi:hypothetical protein